MSESIPSDLRRLVVARSRSRCEYCQLAQRGQAASFHVDHVVPRARGGATVESNLAFACVRCSLKKGDRVDGVAPADGATVAFFSPRSDHWDEHFEWHGTFLVGLTPTGRATVAGLAMNDPPRP